MSNGSAMRAINFLQEKESGLQALNLCSCYALVSPCISVSSGGSRVVPGVPGHHPKTKKDGRCLLG